MDVTVLKHKATGKYGQINATGVSPTLLPTLYPAYTSIESLKMDYSEMKFDQVVKDLENYNCIPAVWHEN